MINHPLQSENWELARKKHGVETLRLSDKNNSFLLTFHKIPYTSYKVGYLPRSVVPSKKILDELYNYGKKNNIIFIKIEPYVEKNSKFEIQNSKLLKSPHSLFPEWTQILDLTKTEDDLLKSFHHKTRYNIRLAEKKGVIVTEMSNDQGFREFSKLYFETCKRQKYFGHNEKYHKIVWDSLKNNISHIMIAKYQNITLAAYELFFYKDTIYYVYGGTSELHRNLMASNLLMWETIKLGKKLGAKKLDMWGSLPPNYDQKHSWSGFTRFKEGYGTKFVEFIGSFDLVINPFLYKVYNLAFEVRGLFLRLLRSVA